MTAEHTIGPAIFTQITPSEWDQLVSQSMTNTPFQRHAYQQAWWTHLGHGRLLTIVVRNEQNDLLGLGCFMVEEGVAYFNGSKEESDYLDLITPRATAEPVWNAVLTALTEAGCTSLDLHCIPAASLSRNILPRLLTQRGFFVTELVEEVCPLIILPNDFELYLEELNKKQRHEIRRKLRRAEEAGATLEVVTAVGDELTTAVEQFLALLQSSMHEKEDWLNDGRRALFHELAHAAQQNGSLQLLFLRLKDTRYAALFNFQYAGRTWVYNSGINITEHSNLSLGIVLSTHAIDQAITLGHHTFDFLRGDEVYKYRFGAADSFIYHLQAPLRP